jgi:hypothetical protein
MMKKDPRVKENEFPAESEPPNGHKKCMQVNIIYTYCFIPDYRTHIVCHRLHGGFRSKTAFLLPWKSYQDKMTKTVARSNP